MKGSMNDWRLQVDAEEVLNGFALVGGGSGGAPCLKKYSLQRSELTVLSNEENN